MWRRTDESIDFGKGDKLWLVMICAPAEARPAFRVGLWGGTAESTVRTAQMITSPEKGEQSL